MYSPPVNRVSRWAVLAWSVGSLCACAAISGLDSLQRCPDCDGGADVGVDSTGDVQADAPEAATEGGRDSPSDPRDADAPPPCSGVQHDDGLGQTFCDAVPAGTYTEQLATDACEAYVSGKGQWDGSGSNPCASGACSSGDAGNGDLVVCSYFDPVDCVCWTYQGPDMGDVHDTMMGPSTCLCSVGGGDPMFH